MSKQKNTQTSPRSHKPESALRASDKKWGKEVMGAGFSVIPSLLFKTQKRLGLTPTKLAIILQLSDFWWEKERNPHPSKDRLSSLLDLSPRQIQRHIAELEQAGFVRRIGRRGTHGGKLTNFYDLSGLIGRLKELAPEYSAARNEAKDKIRKVSTKGFRPSGKKAPK